MGLVVSGVISFCLLVFGLGLLFGVLVFLFWFWLCLVLCYGWFDFGLSWLVVLLSI